MFGKDASMANMLLSSICGWAQLFILDGSQTFSLSTVVD